MSDKSINAPIGLENGDFEECLYTNASASTVSLKRGMGVCYDFDYGTAANSDASRMNRVELPSATNNRFFAGVLGANYSVPGYGKQIVRVWKPGSTCQILSRASTTVGVGILTCEAGGTYAGYFKYAGFQGQGSATPLQTVDRSSTAGLCLAKLQEGEQSGLVEVPTLDPAGGAATFMVGGVTIFDTATTLAANITNTLADSTISGLKKMFKCMAAMTTSDIVITVTSGKQGAGNADPTAALATITLDADNEEVEMRWGGTEANGHWGVTYVLGSVLS